MGDQGHRLLNETACHTLVCEIVRHGDLSRELTRAQAQAFVDWSWQHRLSPVLARQLGEDHPLQARWQRSLAQAWAAHEVAKQFLNAFRQEQGSLDWILFKGIGAAYSPEIYHQPWRRILGDLDVLVPPGQLGKAIEKAHAMGFESFGPNQGLRQAKDHLGYNHPLVHPSYGVLEIHFRLWGDISEALVEEMLGRVGCLKGAGKGLKRVALTDLFIVANVHFWLSTNKGYGIWLWEILQMSRTFTLSQWDTLINCVQRYGLQVFVSASLRLIRQIWPGLLPARLHEMERRFWALCNGLEKKAVHHALRGAIRGWPLSLARRISMRPTRDTLQGLGRLRRRSGVVKKRF